MLEYGKMFDCVVKHFRQRPQLSSVRIGKTGYSEAIHAVAQPGRLGRVLKSHTTETR
jgi:hypothetical protein